MPLEMFETGKGSCAVLADERLAVCSDAFLPSPTRRSAAWVHALADGGAASCVLLIPGSCLSLGVWGDGGSPSSSPSSSGETEEAAKTRSRGKVVAIPDCGVNFFFSFFWPCLLFHDDQVLVHESRLVSTRYEALRCTDRDRLEADHLLYE
jgi:hypothetical protein